MDLLFLALLFVLMYVLLIRPQKARMRRQRDLVTSLQAGDEVLTAGGIVGTITVLGEEEVRLEVTSGVELRVLRGAISRRLGPADDEDADIVDADIVDDDGPADDGVAESDQDR